MTDKIKVINQYLDNVTSDGVLEMINHSITKNKKLTIATVNPEFLVLSYKDKNFSKALSVFDIKVVDGFGIQLMTKLFTKKRFAQRIPGVDLTYDIFNLSAKNNYSVVVVGSSKESARKAQKNIDACFSHNKINFIDGGIIDVNKIDNILIQKIKKFKPQLLLVALGSPKQEYFILNVLNDIQAQVFMGIGGTTDFISGISSRAPQSWRKSGFEWLWRLFHEPHRWRRILNAVFVFPSYYFINIAKRS